MNGIIFYPVLLIIMKINDKFLPITREEIDNLGWGVPDFVYVSGDAYVDHPTFGAAVITRTLESHGFKVAVLSQPEYHSCEEFKKFGRPRLGFLVSAGNIDSMVAHYTVSKKRRNDDYYSAGGKSGKRPDRAVIVYCNRIREAYGDIPIIIGGLEASLRRFAHYDYWDNKIRRSILIDSGADILSYGMGERSIPMIAKLLDKGVPIKKIRSVKGTVYTMSSNEEIRFEYVGGYTFEDIQNSHENYAKSFMLQYKENDYVKGKPIIEYYGKTVLVQNPPSPPLEREELDKFAELPYTRTYHPIYEKDGGVPAINEVRFSITHNRGCFGACNFCALAFHQGRSVRSRSIESVVSEARLLSELPDFKGYIHDIGGPTANFRYPSCKRQLSEGVCSRKKCLTPSPCKNLEVDHSEYLELIRQVEALPRVKKVFIRSGIRFDYLVLDKDKSFFTHLVRNNISGQLRVAPEHCSDNVLSCMGKPPFAVYKDFINQFERLTIDAGKEQYAVPYLMSSHPGSTLNDAVELALYLKRNKLAPEQVQDFYPTPGTASTVMYYTGLDPFTMKPVFVARSPEEKKMQRALLQYYKAENTPIIIEALKLCKREDLIGYKPKCLVRPQNSSVHNGNSSHKHSQHT